MNNQKVLIVHNYYLIPGGEDTVVENESTMLMENGHEVIFYTRHNDEIKNISILGKIKLFFVSIFSVKTYREVKKIIKEEKIDIVHVHNTLPLISPSVYYAAFKVKVPVVQTIHNFRLICPAATLTRNGLICEKCIKNGLAPALKYKCYRKSYLQTFAIVTMLKIHRMLKTYQKINGYIALTEFNKNKLLSLVDDDKVHVKPNFVKGTSNRKDEKREVENYFVFIGRLDKLKGIDLIIESWKDIKETGLIVLGDGPLKKELDCLIKDSKINNIQLLGFMKREEAFEILKKAKAIIMASQWYEGFPMTIVESFSLGVPVIAGDIGNLGAIITHKKNGLLFKYRSKDDLKENIDMLINDNELNEKLSVGAYKTFIENYDDKINYKYLNNIYSELIGDANDKM
ncbi:glycosyltransferase family 4 protein [Clostridium sp.]|uniref:glycosyltransferase family 4 protein n=1 Tax=Clostridium sp. TaxID=1506 RepID=UPI003D6D7ED5